MYKLTHRAVDDFARIYDHTLQHLGKAQADYCTAALDGFFQTSARMPEIWREYPAVADVRRIEFQQHVIFYTVRNADILIIRILHQQMHPAGHLLAEA